MKVIIAGSRSITDRYVVEDAIDASGLYEQITEVVSGDAAGVDRLGAQWAHERRILVTVFRANWNQHGKGAGPIRNREMAAYADAAIVVWDGTSRGAAHMYETMVERGKPAFLYRPGGAS